MMKKKGENSSNMKKRKDYGQKIRTINQTAVMLNSVKNLPLELMSVPVSLSAIPNFEESHTLENSSGVISPSVIQA